MAALVTLDVAKSHLRISDNESDDDVQRKIEQASGIVLDYLKSRAHKTATITSSSVASPTVITTEEAHGFVSGETATIEDHEDSAPDLNGSHVVTVTSTTTFTVPVAVTVAGTGGSVEVPWDIDTVPASVQTAILLMVVHLHENRGDDMKSDDALWGAIRRLLERSRDPAFA
jgi:Flp pilus assembly protein TadG